MFTYRPNTALTGHTDPNYPALALVLQSQFGWGRLPAFRSREAATWRRRCDARRGRAARSSRPRSRPGYGQTDWSSCTSASVGGSGGRSRAAGRWPTCEGCCARSSARTAGGWPSRPVRDPRWDAAAVWPRGTPTGPRRPARYVSSTWHPRGAVLDETGFVKKGDRSAGVQRLYSGTAGKHENCQVAVFFAYASTRWGGAGRPGPVPPRVLDPGPGALPGGRYPRGGGLPDQAAAGPGHAGAGPGRRGAVWVGDRRHRLWRRPAPAGVAGGACDPACHGGQVHRAAVDADRPWPWAGRRPGPDRRGRARAVAAHQCRGWQQGQTVLRLDQGAAVALGLARHRGVPGCWPAAAAATLGSWPTTSASPPADTSLVTLVQVAGCRWRVEEAFEQAKGEVGLDHYQVRQNPAWYRHITLAMARSRFWP